jgi:hypothetical protein
MRARFDGARHKGSALLWLAASAIVGGCSSFLDLTKEGEGVRIATADAVSACTGLGRTTASVVHEFASIPRNPDAVQENINVTARNSAASMGGDTLVPVSPVAEGKQTFEVYRCRR